MITPHRPSFLGTTPAREVAGQFISKVSPMLTSLKLTFVAVLGLALSGTAGALGRITDVSVRQLKTGAAVHVGGLDIAKPLSRWEDGALVLTFIGELSAKRLNLHPERGAIAALSFCQDGACVSVAVRPRVSSDPRIARASDGWLISFEPQAQKEALSDVPPNPDEVLCSLQVSEMDPATILQSLSTKTHASLVLLSKPDTKLTISLSQIPLSEMIGHICAMCDLTYIRVGKAYIIATPERLQTGYPKEWAALHPAAPAPPPKVEDIATETYETSFTTGEDIVKALEKIYTGKGLTFVAGPPPMSPDIADQDGSKATGTSTSVLTKATTTDSAARLVVITGDRDLVASAMEMAKNLDKPRKQVAIAVTIHDISNDALSDLGITWDFGKMSLTESQPKGVNFGSFGRSPITINTTLAALNQSGKSKLLASPNVSVLDGERAFVLIGDRISYPVLVGYSQNNAPIFSKEEERVGIYLQVSASIGRDGAVTLSLYPQVSTISGYLTINGASYPQVSTREAQTTLRVKSGETIVMGGLFSDEEIATVEKVPFLSQIPILGAIFQHRKVTKTKSQVIITVTPTVIPEGSK